MPKSRANRNRTALVRRGTTPARTAARSKRPTGSARRARGRAEPKAGQDRGSAKRTTKHEVIQKWVEARGGHPATVKRTTKGRQTTGIIRIDFPGFKGAQSLKPIPWDEWFRMFEERKLAFLYQEKTSSGKQSRFNKLVSRE